MKNNYTFQIGIVAALFFASSIFGQKNNLNSNQTKFFKLDPSLKSDDYLSRNVILQVKSTYRNICGVTDINHQKFQAVMQQFGVQNLKKKFPKHTPPATEVNERGQRYADLSLIYEFSFTTGSSLEKVINACLATGILEWAEPHYVPKAGLTTNDPQATNAAQYNIYKIKAAGTGTTGWNISTGDTNVVIGITDTGWDPAHPDLNDNVKRNYADPINGLDDDGDGFIDNFLGWDVGEDDNNATYGSCGSCWHGVHVAGTAAAETNNSTGVAGVGYNCKFLPVKIADASGALVSAYDGITYAADHGCQVINCSWGGPGGGNFGQTVVTYATVNKNSLVIASAGNDGAEVTNYPAAYDYVISVANTNNSDAKSSSSTYALSVDVSAPGTNILSTVPNSSYQNSTGTSMAAPCVAGAAGVVKAFYPSYTAQQVGARLKQTADNIYTVTGNNAYLNKLGTGRINLYRALTDPVTPYLSIIDHTVTDNNDNAFVIGDTLFITADYINYFGSTGNVTATLAPSGTNLTTIDNSTTLGVIGQNQTVNNNQDPFKFKINTGTPVNTVITFTLSMTDGTVSASNFFSVTVNVDYIHIAINDIATTATSKGKIGYNDASLTVGNGFKYNGTQLMAEGGFMCGSSATKVSDCVRDASGTAADFNTVTNISEVVPSVFSEFDLTGKFNDAAATSPMNLIVTHNEYAWSTPGNTKYVIWEYKIKNNATTTLNNFYAGIFADWDIDGTTYAQNKAMYDATNKMGYIYHTATGGLYAGIKLLTSTAAPNFYALDNAAGGGGGVDPNTGGYTTAEKYTTLSTQRLQSSNNVDAMEVMGTGPYSILAGDTITVAFALLAGDDLSDLQNSAVNAQIAYDGIILSKKDDFKNYGISIYPNPNQGMITVEFSDLNEVGILEFFNLMGQKVFSLETQGNKTTVATSGWVPGTYFCKFSGQKGTVVKKLIVEN